MKILIISLLFALFLGGVAQATIIERVIYAGDTPLASDCLVTQTGPMELTVMPCFWTTTGQARILGPIDSLIAATGIGTVARALREGKAEWHYNRVRVWLRDKQDNIIERSVTYQVTPKAVLTIVAGQKYAVYMLQGPGQTMTITLMDPEDPRPSTFINYLVFRFDVPTGTTDLSTITFEVFTVRPDFPPAKSLFEK